MQAALAAAAGVTGPRDWLEGEYGEKGIFLGVPVKLGRKGLEKVIEVTLTADERKALEASAQAVREPMSVVKL